MAVRRGSATPSKIYRGTVPVKRVMRGTVEVWSASIYPITGEWGPTNVEPQVATFDSHVIEEVGEYTITHTATSSGSPAIFVASIRTPHGITSGGNGSPSTATITGQFQPGDLIEFRAASINASTASGTWSITKH